MRIEIVPLQREQLPFVAGVLAERHRRDRLRFPVLPARMEAPARLRHPLSFSYRRSHGAVAALVDGRFCGYLFAELLRIGPHDLDAMFYPPDAAVVPSVGHATIDDLSPDLRIELYRRMYAAAAYVWRGAGSIAHYVKVTAGDADVLEAWTSLGFGGHEAFGVRVAQPLGGAGDVAGIEIRAATLSDIDAVHQCVIALSRYHAGAPMFYPYLPSTEQAQRVLLEQALTTATDHYLLASQAEKPVGVLGIHGPFGEMELLPRACPHIHFAWVEPTVRGSGVGRLLLDRGLHWAQERGYAICSVGWGTTNLSAHRFWTHHGFEITGLQLQRHLDGRVMSDE